MNIVTRDSAVPTNVDRCAQYRMRNVSRTDFDAYEHLARSQRGFQVQHTVSHARGWLTRKLQRKHRPTAPMGA